MNTILNIIDTWYFLFSEFRSVILDYRNEIRKIKGLDPIRLKKKVIKVPEEQPQPIPVLPPVVNPIVESNNQIRQNSSDYMLKMSQLVTERYKTEKELKKNKWEKELRLLSSMMKDTHEVRTNISYVRDVLKRCETFIIESNQEFINNNWFIYSNFIKIYAALKLYRDEHEREGYLVTESFLRSQGFTKITQYTFVDKDDFIWVMRDHEKQLYSKTKMKKSPN